MKRLSELSREELVVLTEEEIHDLIDLECMYNGKAVMVDEPKYLEVPNVPEKDIKTFEVAGHIFTDYAEAVRIRDMIENATSRVKVDYNNGNYDMKFARKIRENDYDKQVSIKKNRAYSEEKYLEVNPTLEKIKEIKNVNAELKDAYMEIVESRQEIVNSVFDAIRKANSDTYKINRAVVAYEKYLRLSNNDNNVAMNFFKESEFANCIDDVKVKMNL